MRSMERALVRLNRFMVLALVFFIIVMSISYLYIRPNCLECSEGRFGEILISLFIYTLYTYSFMYVILSSFV